MLQGLPGCPHTGSQSQGRAGQTRERRGTGTQREAHPCKSSSQGCRRAVLLGGPSALGTTGLLSPAPGARKPQKSLQHCPHLQDHALGKLVLICYYLYLLVLKLPQVLSRYFRNSSDQQHLSSGDWAGIQNLRPHPGSMSHLL